MTDWYLAALAGREAEWAQLDPPATLDDLAAQAKAGEWASPAHAAAYRAWTLDAGARLVEIIEDELGVDVLEHPDGIPAPARPVVYKEA